VAGEVQGAGEEKQKKIPVDTKLLTDAVIELNISRRSVGLYPREHPIVKESIERAFGLLRKLFELREDITLGIAKDTLIIDDNILDRRNPVFKEFALALYGKGIAAVSFRSGLVLDELITLHEIIVSKEAASVKEVMEMAGKHRLVHVVLTPLDISKLGFAEGRLREGGGDKELWENYISALIEGTLADDDAEGVIFNIPPEEIAALINERVPAGARDETYDRVITSYLKRKESSGIKTELFSRFMSLVNGLSSELKQQFLERTFRHPAMDHAETERLLAELSPADIEKIMSIFGENKSLIPESVVNLLDKLRDTKVEGGFFDVVTARGGLIDDIEIDDNILRLLEGDHFKSFVGEEYRKELERMMRETGTTTSVVLKGLEEECREEVLSSRLSELLLEILNEDALSMEDYLVFLTTISEMATEFLDTGRFSEVSEIYNAVYSQTLNGKFRDEARSMIDYFFR